MLFILLVMRTRSASRLWLRAFPRVLRNRIIPYLEPSPAVHPHLPSPDEIQVGDDAYERSATNIRRAVFSTFTVSRIPNYISRDCYCTAPAFLRLVLIAKF
jgi:hypothetical protein